MRSRIGRLVLALFACLMPVSVATTGAQAAEVGVVPDITWGQPREVVDREIELLEQAGVQWVRTNVNWAYIEPQRGQIHQGLLSQYDYAVRKAREAGMRVLMLIGGNDVPYWASGDPNKYRDGSGREHWDKRYPPADMQDYGNLVRWTVEHFSPMGVVDYEIWNEPNLEVFWSPKPNAREYVKMLRAAYPAAKEANPQANVVLGGLSRNDYVFLEEVYAHGGGDYFDAVAVHPYTWDDSPLWEWRGRDDWGPLKKGDPDRISWNCFPGIKEVRRSMVANGDAHKKVWATEFGWSVTSQADGVSPQTQARYLREAFEYVEDLPWVKAMFWYTARDNPFWTEDHWEARTGLFTVDFKLRPAYHALKEYATRGQAPQEPPAEQPPPEEQPPAEELPTEEPPAKEPPAEQPPADGPSAQPPAEMEGPKITLKARGRSHKRGKRVRIVARGQAKRGPKATTSLANDPLASERPARGGTRVKVQVRLRGKWRTKARPRVVAASYKARFKVRVKRPRRTFLVRTVVPSGAFKVTRVRVAR